MSKTTDNPVVMHSVFIFVSILNIEPDHAKLASCLRRLLCLVFVLEIKGKNVRWTEISLKIMLSSSQSISHGKSQFPIIFITSLQTTAICKKKSEHY